MPASAEASSEEIKDANTRYHDAAATSYDSKWGIDFGPIGQQQVRDKMRKALGGDPARPFGDALEIGAGTGYFSLNLLQLGMVERATATDISPGMLATLSASAAGLGLEIKTVRSEAEQLPFADDSFDLVLGHAVLHHIPDLRRAFAEFHRVLRPGGVLVFCGEPSRYGDRLAALPKRAALALAPLWRRMLNLELRRDFGAPETAGEELEWQVDVHAFSPAALRGLAGAAGFGGTRVKGEELLANMYGWWLRTIESTADPEQVPARWQVFAFRSYLALQRVDNRLLEPHLPPELFYNLLVSARKAG
jgi:ubiquinone/menaquinone biosynthesis C-methylase UbiE